MNTDETRIKTTIKMPLLDRQVRNLSLLAHSFLLSFIRVSSVFIRGSCFLWL
jgi:hypothetical protein